MRGERIGKGTVLGTIVIIVSFLGCGCGPKVRVRASDTFFQSNPSKKIAILSEGKVNWPRLGQGGNVLVLPHCKEATEESLAMTKEVLANKGYEVVYAEAVGVGFNSNGWYCMENPDSTMSQITDAKPIFLSEQFQDDTEFNKSVMNVIEQLELAINQNRLDYFTPAKEDIDVIQQFTEADTICLHRVYGTKYSTRRKVGGAVLQVVGALPILFGVPAVITRGPPSDMVEELYIFVDAKTGVVLWQGGVFTEGDPLDPKKNVESVLNFLPAANEPFNYIYNKACGRARNGLDYCR